MKISTVKFMLLLKKNDYNFNNNDINNNKFPSNFKHTFYFIFLNTCPSLKL